MQLWIAVALALCCALSCGNVRAGTVRFAVIGDYGTDDANELAVAELVKTNFQPEFIVTVGDNNYLGASNIDQAIGKYYHEYIGSYSGAYGAGATSNRFFPALANHDWDEQTGFSVHLDYFTLPGNERYYDFVRGPAHIFILNSDPHEPDGNTSSSVQAAWFSNQIAASTSPWRVVICQDPPYSSTESLTWMRWPFTEWGASVVISGDSHQYERIMLDGFPYIVNGAGGASLAGFGNPISGSVVRYGDAHGAMVISATESNINYQFWSVANGGTLVDEFTEAARPKLSISSSNAIVRVAWPTNLSGGFVLQSKGSLDPAVPWTNVSTTATISAGRFITTVPASSGTQFFRLAQ